MVSSKFYVKLFVIEISDYQIECKELSNDINEDISGKHYDL
jgi:hypothetical protein